jgi:ABC-2 type transport system ATP-binding protein
MDEAERLCDRIMVIDRGRLVAIDSPSGLIRRSGSDQTLRFSPSVPIDDEVLTGLSEVVTVHREGSQIVITGTGNVVQAVSSLLARRGVIAEDLRVDQTSLEDAYLELTNRSDVSAKSASEER